MKDDPQFQIVEFENMSPEARQQAIEYLKNVRDKLYQQLEMEQREKERKRKEAIQELESQFVYCPECCGVIAKLAEQTVCPNCGTASVKLAQANHQKLSEYLKSRELNVDFSRYIWHPKYGEEMTSFRIRCCGQQFYGTGTVLRYTQLDKMNVKTRSVSVILSENDWHSIREFLQTLRISRWITPCDLALSFRYSRYSDEEEPDGFQCFCGRYDPSFSFLKDPEIEYSEEYLQLFTFIKQIFQRSEGWQLLEKCGVNLAKPLQLPDVRVMIRDDSSGKTDCVEIPFQSKVLIGNSSKAHIMVPSIPIPYALRPQGDHFLLHGGGGRFMKVWNGEKWVSHDLLKKGDRFKLRGHEFTLVDFDYVCK